MKTIYKYQIVPLHGIQEIMLPFGSKLLSVIEQDTQIQLYVSHEYPDSLRDCKHRYICVGTGWAIEVFEFTRFIGTVKQGPFVWHVFEVEDLPF